MHSQTPEIKNRLHQPGFQKTVDSLVHAYMELDIFSGVVLIAEKGQPVYHKAFGLANRKENIPNTLGTRFDIGSMNKSFTKVLILKLANRGIIKLDDPLGRYLEGFPPQAAQKITIEHLLNHKSGYGGYHTEEYWNIPYKEKSLKQAEAYIRKLPLEFEPGKERRYSNAGYVLLGRIAEEATGKSYFDLVEEHITTPLQMNDTYLREKYTVPQRAIGYFKTMKGELEDNDSFQEIVTPAGGFYSTTSDILKFYRAYHYGDKLWDQATQKLDEAYPHYRRLKAKGGLTGHAGGFEGANTVHLEFLKEEISIIVFANMDEIVAENLANGIVALLKGETPTSPALPAVQSVYKAFIKEGAAFVKANWEQLSANFHPQDPKDMILNMIGYNLLYNGEVDDALGVFKLNTELFPSVPNVWDSYGEGLRKSGAREEALKAYQKALALQPGLESARKAIDELEGKQ